MSFGFGVGDFLATSQLAWKLYRDYYRIAHVAPREIELLRQEISTLYLGIKLLLEEIDDEGSVLRLSGDLRVLVVNEMMSRVADTLKELECVSKKYHRIFDDKKGHYEIARQLLKEKGLDFPQEAAKEWLSLYNTICPDPLCVLCLAFEEGIPQTQLVRLLPFAATFGHETMARLLLDNGTDIVEKDDNCCTALHCAAKHGHEATLRLLLCRNADIESKDGECHTPLHMAAERGHHVVVRSLLDHGVNIEALSHSYKTPLHFAAENGQRTIVELLCFRNAKIDATDSFSQTSLYLAVQTGHEAVVRSLVDHGADMTILKEDGEPLLHLSAKEGHIAMLELLLFRGADINSAKGNQATALHIAAEHGKVASAQKLLHYGIEVDIPDMELNTPLHYAAQGGHKATVQLLLNCNAIIEAKGIWNSTPLHRAVIHGEEAVTRELLDRGADVNYKGGRGLTPLHSIGSGETMAKLLLDFGAQIEAQKFVGESPLFHLALYDHTNSVKQLQARGANVHARENRGNTVLHAAVMDTADGRSDAKDIEPLISILLHYGANTTARNDEGCTPLHYAALHGNAPTVRLFFDRGLNMEIVDNRGRTSLHHAIS